MKVIYIHRYNRENSWLCVWNYKLYLKTFPDLIHLCPIEAYEHSMKHGIKHGIETDNFDYDFYLETYPDLRHFTLPEAYEHYITYGIEENRICNREMIAQEDKK